MAVFDGIIDEIISALRSDTQLNDIKFIDSFKSYKRPNPLQYNLVTVGIKKVELKDRAFGKYLGVINGNEFFGKGAEISITLNIYVPKNKDGATTAEIFSRICNTLISDNLEEQILSIECGDIDFNKSYDAFVLDCLLKLKVVIGSGNDESDITSIIIKGEI